MPTAAILGTGLIGASIGMGLRGSGWTVVGWDPEPAALESAWARGALDEAAASEAAAVEAGADLVVLAGPVVGIVATLERLETAALVTDVAGVKGAVVEAGSHLPRFVGGHPMAGREVAGPEAASAALFRGAAWVIVDDGASDEDVAAVAEIVTGLGARPLRMTAEAHDTAVGAISHLPQVLAAALLRHAAETTEALDLAAGSFRDLTRVAASDPDAWSKLLVANGPPVAGEVRRFAARLQAWAAAIEGGEVDALHQALGSARVTREALAPPVVAVGVALADRPGELAKVGSALSEAMVDVRDIQLRHSPHGGGGLLSLYVRPGDDETLRAALESQGLIVA